MTPRATELKARCRDALSNTPVVKNFIRFPFTIVNSPEPYYEEGESQFREQRYYPVVIGNDLNNRYRVIGKVGHGFHSTTWLCKDKRSKHHPFVVVKVGRREPFSVQREAQIYEFLDSIQNPDRGKRYIRPLIELFQLKLGNDSFHGLVHPPLAISLQEFLDRCKVTTERVDMIQWATLNVLKALVFLHGAGVVHADLHASNIMFEFGRTGKRALKRFAREEKLHPSDRKVILNLNPPHTVYEPRKFDCKIDARCRSIRGGILGEPVLSDIGLARRLDDVLVHDIQPPPYRAPEVILELPWGTAIDIWNLGCLVHYLLHSWNEPQFSGLHHRRYNKRKQIAQMIAPCGQPPRDMAKASGQVGRELGFNERGKWKGGDCGGKFVLHHVWVAPEQGKWAISGFIGSC